jgi:4-hydroxy-3-methylbut-2-enyl diphosphate reductase IspH
LFILSLIFLFVSLLKKKDFGFCWGVERSIALAYEAVDHFPGKKIHITNELIHNPEVNEKLEALNVQFIQKVEGSATGEKDFSNIQDGDVVILPAFGASFEEMALFDKKVRIYIYVFWKQTGRVYVHPLSAALEMSLIFVVYIFFK